MNITINHQNKDYQCDLNQPVTIAIPLKHGEDNPNCFWANPPEFSTIRLGDFVGSIKEGGNVNYQHVSITPHGNGTHTECYGHISDDEEALLTNCLNRYHFIARLITVATTTIDGDEVVSLADYEKSLGDNLPEAIIMRTLPNGAEKKTYKYSGDNPSYLDPSITKHMADHNILHLLLDLPSVDREEDEGRLTAHKNFWDIDGAIRKECTITELIYVPDTVADGLYLLNLQTPNMAIDAAPSRPVIYPLQEVFV